MSDIITSKTSKIHYYVSKSYQIYADHEFSVTGASQYAASLQITSPVNSFTT